jgi:hypothetical protein
MLAPEYVTQFRCQHPLGDVSHESFDFVEALRPILQNCEQKKAPLIPQFVGYGSKKAGLGVFEGIDSYPKHTWFDSSVN